MSGCYPASRCQAYIARRYSFVKEVIRRDSSNRITLLEIQDRLLRRWGRGHDALELFVPALMSAFHLFSSGRDGS